MSQPYSHKDSRYGIRQQSVWGTAEADGGAAIEMNVEAFEIPFDVKFNENQNAHGSREDNYGNVIVTPNLGLPKFTIQGELNLNDFDHFLFAFFQTSGAFEGGSAPYPKTFTRHLTQPDFSSGGHYLTVYEWDPVRGYKAKDCIVETLKMSWKAGEKMKFQAGMIARGNKVASTPSGTWTQTDTADPATIDYFNRFTINFGAGAQSPYIASLELDLKRTKIEGYGGGSGTDFQGLGLGAITGTFDYEIMKDANFSTAGTNLVAGTPVSVRLGKGNATAGTVNGDFDIVHTGKLMLPETVKADPIMNAHIKGRILAPDAATPGTTITMANNIDRAW